MLLFSCKPIFCYEVQLWSVNQGLQPLIVQYSVLTGVHDFSGGVQDQLPGGCCRPRPPGAIRGRSTSAAAAEPRAEHLDALVRALLWRAGQEICRGGVRQFYRSLHVVPLAKVLDSGRRSRNWRRRCCMVDCVSHPSVTNTSASSEATLWHSLFGCSQLVAVKVRSTSFTHLDKLIDTVRQLNICNIKPV